MRYAEIAPPPELAQRVKAGWTLECDGAAGETVLHSATPDGCIEIIRRVRGGSLWQREQPRAFVAGVITKPALLRFSGDASFVGVRLWPWVWNALADVRSPALVDTWLPLREAATRLPTPSLGDPFAGLATLLNDCADDVGRNILRSQTVAELVQRSGRQRRWLQRWFAREIGIAPRRYFRLLRFQEALRHLQDGDSTLADEAAAHGYADQAHMTRDFKSLAGAPTGAARRAAQGPFVRS